MTESQRTSEHTPAQNAALSDLELLARAEHHDPFSVLGAHLEERGDNRWAIVRTFQPQAADAWVTWCGRKERYAAARVHEAGIFEARVPLRSGRPGGPPADPEPLRPSFYRWNIRRAGGTTAEFFDPYAFPPVLTDYDLHLLAEGNHFQSYERLGAHVREVDGVAGVHFAVWAPNARRVSVVADFNSWNGRTHPMRNCGAAGIWEIFVPGLAEGQIYKYEILSQISGHVSLKADPVGFAAELRPRSASVVSDLSPYKWGDAEWLAQRKARNLFREPILIYEVHAGSWKRVAEAGHRWLTYAELAAQLIPYVKQMGFTHIELMPLMEHPFDGSWGYQTIGYYAATSRYGAPRELMHFIDTCHQAGLGVILDWTPAHFPRDAHGLSFFDGTHLYEHADPRRGSHPDWGTLVFNYGRNEVRNFLLSNALFWLDKYHVDGLRVDAVASMLYLDYSRSPGEWLPNVHGGRENLEAIYLLRRLSELIHERFPGVLTIAEESTAWPAVSRPTYDGGLGFDLKWNMGWMNDTLRYMSRDPIYRRFHHNELTFSMIYAFNENFVLPLSHDEVVHGKKSLLDKMPGDAWQKFANLRLLYAFMYAHPGKKMLFMGSELAPWKEWTHEESLGWDLLQDPAHAGIQRLVTELNQTVRREPALHKIDFEWQGFEWLEANDADASTLAFLRRGPEARDFVVVACNFTPVVRKDCRVAVPEPGFYVEILNTDSEHFGGTNVGNSGGVQAEPVPWNGRPYSLKITLPPLAALYFKPSQ